jgi:hypothetical protein
MSASTKGEVAMVWQAMVFLALMIGIPVVVAWVLGGDKRKAQEQKLERARQKAAKAETGQPTT